MKTRLLCIVESWDPNTRALILRCPETARKFCVGDLNGDLVVVEITSKSPIIHSSDMSPNQDSTPIV